jgi:hypothetical protein
VALPGHRLTPRGSRPTRRKPCGALAVAAHAARPLDPEGGLAEATEALGTRLKLGAEALARLACRWRCLSAWLQAGGGWWGMTCAALWRRVVLPRPLAWALLQPLWPRGGRRRRRPVLGRHGACDGFDPCLRTREAVWRGRRAAGMGHGGLPARAASLVAWRTGPCRPDWACARSAATRGECGRGLLARRGGTPRSPPLPDGCPIAGGQRRRRPTAQDRGVASAGPPGTCHPPPLRSLPGGARGPDEVSRPAPGPWATRPREPEARRGSLHTPARP